MSDLSIRDDPFSRPFELARPIRTIIFADGEPTDFVKTPTKSSISPDLIALVEGWGRESVGFFGDRRTAWERGK